MSRGQKRGRGHGHGHGQGFLSNLGDSLRRMLKKLIIGDLPTRLPEEINRLHEEVTEDPLHEEALQHSADQERRVRRLEYEAEIYHRRHHLGG